MDLSDIRKNYPAISAAANDVLSLLGPGFANRTQGHVETDIAAAASLAGVSMLRSKGFDLREFKPGTVVLTELDTEMNEIWSFMMAAAKNMGLDPSSGWDGEIPEANKPIYSILEMTRKTKKKFSCNMRQAQSEKRFFSVCCCPGSPETRIRGG